MWPTSIWKYVANPHWKSALWWSPPPLLISPRGLILTQLRAKVIKMTICFSTLFPLSQSALLMSVRHHCPSDVINLQCSPCQRCFRGWTPDFVYDIFISFFGHWFFCTWESHVGMVYLYRICIFFSFLTSYRSHFLYCSCTFYFTICRLQPTANYLTASSQGLVNHDLTDLLCFKN